MKPTILPFNGITPRIHPTAFVAPGCQVIGDVEIGPGASLWYNVVVRGDINHVRIGARTNIQDGTIVHVTSGAFPTIIEEDVVIGHMAMIHGCRLARRSFVGLGAIIMDGCAMEEDTMLAAGAMLTPGKRIPGGQMWAGRPAKYLRDLTDKERDTHDQIVARYMENGALHQQAIDAALAGE